MLFSCPDDPFERDGVGGKRELRFFSKSGRTALDNLLTRVEDPTEYWTCPPWHCATQPGRNEYECGHSNSPREESGQHPNGAWTCRCHNRFLRFQEPCRSKDLLQYPLETRLEWRFAFAKAATVFATASHLRASSFAVSPFAFAANKRILCLLVNTESILAALLNT